MLSDMALSQAVEYSPSLHNINKHLSKNELEEAMKQSYYCAPNEVKLEVTSNEKEFHYAFSQAKLVMTTCKIT